MRNCCLSCIDGETCNCISSDKLQRPVFVQNIFKIIVLVLYIVTTEGCLFYLSSITVEWRKDFSSFNFNRIVAWFSLASTLLLTFAIARSARTQLPLQDRNICLQCNGRLIIGRRIIAAKRSWRDLIYIDFIHSFVVAILMLYCAFRMIVDIPRDYKHHMEVALKLLGFGLDAVLSLLFTKSSIAAYTALEGSPTRCLCDDDSVLWKKTVQSTSAAPFDDEESSPSSEDGDRVALISPHKDRDKAINSKKISS